MGRRPTFTQAEITRAISAALAAGMAVTRCEIGSDGSIVLCSVPVLEKAKDPYDVWQEARR
jgi:hypothetical protein